MWTYLNFIDMFGIVIALNMFKKSKFTTNFGGFLTILVAGFSVGFTVIFGSDFYFKTNPNFFQSEKISLKAVSVQLTTDTYTFMWRTVDGYLNNRDMSNTPYKFNGQYADLRKNAAGKLETYFYTTDVFSPCNETLAVNNPDLKSINLELFTCFDFEKIRDNARTTLKDKDPKYQPYLGGSLDEDDFFTVLTLRASNYKHSESSFASNYEMQKADGFNLMVRYPNALIDADSLNSPVQTRYESSLNNVQPTSYSGNDNYLQLVTLFDDQGGFYKNVEEKQSVKLFETKTVSHSYDMSIEGKKHYFYNSFMMTKRATVAYRKFMKFQEVLAQVSSFIKATIMNFSIVATMMAKLHWLKKVLAEFFITTVTERGEHEENASNIKMENYTGDDSVSKKAKLQQLKIGFWSYYLVCWRVRAETMNEKKVLKQVEMYMEEKMDVATLIDHYDKFEKLVEIVLTEEQKELLNAKNRTLNY